MSNKPKIAFLIQDFNIGGIPGFILRLSKRINDDFDLYFIATSEKNINNGFYDVGTPLYMGENWEKISKFLKEKSVDIVQYGNKIEYKECAINAGVPVIIERTAGPRSCNLDRSGVSYVISSAKGSVNTIRKNYSGPLSVIYNGISLDRKNTSTRDRLGFSDKDFIVCYSSRIGGVGQGFQYLIPAVVKANRENKRIKLVLIGDKPKSSAEDIRPTLNKLAAPLKSDCVFLGEVSDPIDVINGSDICVIPSLHHGISNFAIESFMLEKPVISTQVGYMDEIVIDGKNGILVPPKNIEKLYNGINYLFENRDVCERFGKFGRKYVEKHFDIDKQASKYGSVYWNVLGE